MDGGKQRRFLLLPARETIKKVNFYEVENEKKGFTARHVRCEGGGSSGLSVDCFLLLIFFLANRTPKASTSTVISMESKVLARHYFR